MSSHHKILGVAPNATKSQIKRAYFKKAKVLHPDVNKSPNAEAEFVRVNMAYEALTNPKYVHPPIFTSQKQRKKNPQTEDPRKEWIKRRNDNLRREAYKEAKRKQAAAYTKAFYRSFSFSFMCLVAGLIFLIPANGCYFMLESDFRGTDPNRNVFIVFGIFSILLSSGMFIIFLRYFYLKLFK